MPACSCGRAALPEPIVETTAVGAPLLAETGNAELQAAWLPRVASGTAKLTVGLERAKFRAAQDHTARARRLVSLGRYEEAVVEYQLASELNPTDSAVEAGLKEVRQKLRTNVAVTHDGRTELETLIDRTREMPAPGLDLPRDVKLPGSLVFGNGATARAVFQTVARFSSVG